MSALPRGWCVAEIHEIADVGTGATPKRGTKEFYESGTIPWITSGAVSQGRITYAEEFITEAAIRATNCKVFPSGTILMAMYGEGKTRGSVAELAIEAATNQALAAIVLRQNSAVSGKYLMSFLTSQYSKLRDLAAGGVQPNLNLQSVKATSVPLPPLAEQKRIVAKLDALNAKSDRARTELARIETLVARYKQALLSKAFSGELTREWRLQATQNDIEAALESVRAGRRISSKLARRKPVSDVPQFPLPHTWRWISPDELAADAPYSIGIGPFGSNLVKGDYRAQGVRLVFVRDIRREEFSDENAVYVDSAKAEELHQHWVSGGDVLITKMGDPPGDTAIYPKEQPSAVITADCIKLRPHLELTSSKFLYWAIRSQTVKSQILEETKGVAQQKLSLDRFRQIAIPTPPLEEQHEIVRRIESAFAKIDRLAKEAKRALELVGRLDEAILAKAFRGELVPQDENDEPAEHLIARIRAEREAAPKGKRGRGAKG